MTQEKVTKRRTRFKGAAQEGMARLVDLRPYNDNQKLYLNYLNTHPQILVTGYSGTGKTFLAASYAANMYASREIDKIIITRPNIPVGKDLGYFPGTLEEKIAPWVAPVLDVLTEQLGKGVVDTAIKSGNIEMAPLSTMRGRSFKNSFVLMDEAQNLTTPEMKMFLTRVGQNCKVVINGDIRQSDIKDNFGSGLSKIIHLVKKYNMDIPIVEFGIEDIVRSDICKQWIIAFEEEGL